MSDLQRRMVMGRSGLPPPGGGNSGCRRPNSGRRSTKPEHWSSYFQTSRIIDIPAGKFNLYECDSLSGEEDGATLVLLHGGGYSGLTWSVFAKELIKMVGVRVVALDLRGHGETVTQDDEDLKIATLAQDVASVIDSLGCKGAVVLAGHSMGGAIAVHTASYLQETVLSGLVVIDVVEGTALEALGSMQSFLRGRPDRFYSLPYAVEWSVRSGQTRNFESACVSMPGQLKNIQTNEPATKSLTPESPKDDESKQRLPPLRAANSIAEEDENGDSDSSTASSSSASTPSQGPEYTWRIDLSKTESNWPGWFEGLSSKFLSVSAAKMLLLAGVDRLDKDLTVGQMQGKFQMQILPQAGHAVHEDVPDRVAEVLATFLVRHKFSKALSEFKPSFPAC